jgi:Zn finger protein HypA/HybF involved in hydrogenase expression
MGVSRATFGRIVQRARYAVADALINGKAINVEGGNYRLADAEKRFVCDACDHQWVALPGSGRPDGCPECASDRFYRTSTQK